MGHYTEKLRPGERFGRLTVVDVAPSPSEYITYKGRWYRCRCDCGSETVVRWSSLRDGQIKSCGCMRRETSRAHALELSRSKRIQAGEKFGRLTVLRETDERAFKNVVYECRCQCGNIKLVRGDVLRSGRVKSCGCLRDEIRANFRKKKVEN